MKKLKLLGVPALALAGLLTLFTPSPANAKVRWDVGVAVGSPYYAPYPYGYTYVGPYYHHHHWRHYHYHHW